MVIFNNESCLIQEKKSLRKIVLDDLIEGLYYLTITQALHQVSHQANTNTSQAQETYAFIPQAAL